MLGHTKKTHALPHHWIGIHARWKTLSENPLDSLVSLPSAALATHALLLGATGCGKTTLIHHLIAQDILLGHSFCIIDMRGDLVRAAIELCAGRIDPQLVRVLDLRKQRYLSGFNPLFGSGESYFRALNVLEVVASESESWGVQLAETLRNALLLLAESTGPLTDLERLFFDRGFRDACLTKAESQPLIEFWQRFDALPVERQAGLAGPVLNKVSLLLATKTLRGILGHPAPFDLGKHLNTPGSVLLVSLAADELHAAGRMFGSLMISAISREIFARVPIPEGQRNPVRLYVDEFENLGTHHQFESILAEGRRFKFGAVLAHQTLAQLSPKMRSLILGNVGVKAIFRLGREDCGTLSRDLFGEPKAYDFAELPTGFCVLWQKHRHALELEVSAPLLQNPGELTSEGLAYLQAIYQAEGDDEGGGARCPVSKPPHGPRPAFRRADLGDWLCE